MIQPNLRKNEGNLKIAGLRGENLIIYGHNSVYQLNVKNKELNLLLGKENIGDRDIISVCIDPSNIIWLGNADGVFKFSEKNGVIKPIESPLIRMASCLVADNNDRVWIGAGSNLINYQKNENIFEILGQSDGVISNEYIPQSTLQSKNGDVFLGGVTGLVRITNEYTTNYGSELTPRIISIMQDGTLIDEKSYSLFKENQKITLSHNFKSLIISFIIDGPDFFNKKLIRYSIDGYTKDPVETSNMNLNLTNLPTGKFNLMVSTKLSNGNWSQPRQLLHIKVKPPWWLTWWFLSILIIVNSLFFLLLKHLHDRRARDKMKLELINKENKLNEQRVHFLVNISHELRTPLSLIYGPLKRISNGHITSKEEKENLLKLVIRHVNYIRNLIDQLLDYKKIEKSAMTLNISKHIFNQWLKCTVKEFETLFKDTDVEMVFVLDKSILEVSFDNDKLQKVIYNLMMNIYKHAKNTKKIIVTSELTQTGMVRVSIADEGPGIPKNELSRIFDRFYMIDVRKGNSGIGLAYSKVMVELHGGHIYAKNNTDRGAVFYFEIPVHSIIKTNDKLNNTSTINDSDEQKLDILNKDAKQKQGSVEINKKQLVIMVVEDNPELLNFLSSSLSPYFKKVITASNGLKALELIRSKSPDIIISDVVMPEMNGLELCIKLKTDIEISHIPIILLSARNDETDILKGYKLGADQYLSKPISIDLLLSVTENLLISRYALINKYKNSHTFIDPKEVTFSNTDEIFLTKLNSLIENNIEDQNLNVDYIVDKMAMSRASLYAKMKAITGIGIKTYITNQKIEYAFELLTSTDMLVSEIADNLGFSTQRYFSENFKKLKDYSPTQYRQKFTQTK